MIIKLASINMNRIKFKSRNSQLFVYVELNDGFGKFSKKATRILNRSDQSLSRVRLFATPWIAARQASPVHHQLPEFTQTHVHRLSDAIQLSHPLSSPSPPAPNPSQHQSFPMSQLFAWGGQSIGVSALASVLPKNTQGWSPLEWTGWIFVHVCKVSNRLQ